MSLMMNGIANTVLILIALPILGRCSFAMTSHQNRTHASSLMFIADDVECLAQMPVTDLMKIRNTIKMMHAVTAYDALHRQPPTHPAEWGINGRSQTQNHNRNDSDNDSPLRELDESVSETKHIFKYLSQFTTSTTISPMAQAYMMNGQMHDELIKQQQQLTYEKIVFISANLIIFYSHRVLLLLDAFHFTVMNKFFVQKHYFRHKAGWASEWEEEKPSKVQKVLHYSITALTFLAFAGYLLCMIVQAIKSKGKLIMRELYGVTE